jgi:hypothetical protein
VISIEYGQTGYSELDCAILRFLQGGLLLTITVGLLACGESPTGSAAQTPTVAATPQVLLDIQGSGSKTTEKFTVASDWDLHWSYDCTAGLTRGGVIPSGYHCSFIVHVKQPDGHFSSENQGVNQLGVKDQSVEHYHTAGTFYLEVEVCCSDNSWTVTVTE